MKWMGLNNVERINIFAARNEIIEPWNHYTEQEIDNKSNIPWVRDN